MGCFAEVVAIALAITGLQKLDTNPTQGLIFIGVGIVVALVGWFTDRKDRKDGMD